MTALRPLMCLTLAAAVWSLVGAEPSVRSGLALLALIGSLWLTQALPLAVTALAVPLVAVLANLMTPRDALASFAHPVIFLFLGGFVLAAALSSQGLDRALAALVLRASGGRRWVACVLLAGMTAMLSMWMSNTATTAMMLPLALGLLRSGEGDGAAGAREDAFVLLAVAYSASIGGMATLIGSPPNAIAAAYAGIGFAQWLAFALPTALLMWPLMLGILWLVLRPRLGGRVATPPTGFAWTPTRAATVAIFCLAVAGWAGGAPLARLLGIDADMDTVVALGVIVLLAASGAVTWREAERQTQWGVLLLFGGGIALGEILGASGASRHLAGLVLAAVREAPPALLVLGVIAFVVFFSELASNTASAALLVPVFVPVAAALGLSPPAMAVSIALAASCGFMMPVATPPNAMVFGTGRVAQRTMMLCGLWLNAAGIALISSAAVWGWR